MSNLLFSILVGISLFSFSLSQQTMAQDLVNDTVTDSAVISVLQDGPSDQQILDRIRSIYLQIEQLQAIDVTVVAGVVTVAGSVSNDAQAEQALSLARRVAGVVTVEDQIERTLDVQGNVAPLMDQFTEDFRQWIRAFPLFLLAIGVSIVVAFCGHILANWTTLWRRLIPNPFLSEIVTQMIRIVGIILGLVVGLSLLGATTLMGTILGGAGVVGLAIGFAVRDTMENYISSIMLSLRQPFRANEHVVIDHYEGRVIRLTSRATVLMTLDGNHLRIPNATVFKAVILNYSRNPERRFDFELGVDAEDDPLAAMDTGLTAISNLDFVLKVPKPDAVIKAVGDSNILITFAGWIDQEASDFKKARSLSIRAAKIALEENGFTLPEPIYRLRFDQLPNELVDSGRAALTSKSVVSEIHENGRPERRGSSPAVLAPTSTKVDIAPDEHIESIVNTERLKSTEEDLLDSGRPVE